jgi:tape measure domain-containing protein
MEGGDQRMSSSIDDRVVQLKFDNSAFESAVGVTLSTLDKLKKSLDFSTSRKGLDELQNSASKFNLGNIGTTIEGASGKFLALATIGITALSNIASKAMEVGASILKSLSLDPIMGGFREYETNLNAVQTILSNTQAAGGNLKTVNAALGELNTYSDKTIYNFSEMARNIGTFTAAGVDLDSSVAAIKGIANLAAMSGSNSQQASTAMYQLSQALAAGKVTLMDWNSVVNAGMGGAVFQRALAQTAEKMGVLKDGAVKLTGPMKNVSIAGLSFRNSISDPKVGGWLTSDVLTKTLAQFTGDLSDAELKAQGYSAAEIKSIQAMAKTAMEAATQVKTVSQVIDVAKETAGSGWAQTWQIIFGDFGQAKADFTGLSNAINGVINGMSDARNTLLKGWAALGGRSEAIQALKNAFEALMSFLKPIKDAFREIFPAQTAQDLYDLTVNIRDFFANVKLGTESMDRIQRIFAGVFAVLDIGKQIVRGIVGVFVDLATSVNEGSGGFLEIFARIGDFLVQVDLAIRKGNFLVDFFDGLSTVLQRLIGFFSGIGDAILAIFDGKNEAINATGDAIGRVGDRLSPLGSLLSVLISAWGRFLDVLYKLSPVFAQVLQGISDLFSGIGPAISESVANGNYSAMLDTINTVIFGAIALLFRKFMKDGIKIDAGGGFLEKIGNAFDALTGNLKAMQQELKAKALLEIAGAVALLTISVVALSLIDSKKLSIALGGLGVIFTELMLAMAVLGKIAGGAGFIKIPLIAASLVLLSTAILILTGAVAILGSMDFGTLAKGLGGLAALLAILAVATGPISNNAPQMIVASGALILLGVALNLLALAVKAFGALDLVTMGKGLLGVAGSLVVIAASMQIMPTGMIAQAAALILIGTALNILAEAVKKFGALDLATMGKGLLGIGGALVVIAGAMWLMPPTMVATAASLILVGIALGYIGTAVAQMGSMSWEQIGKGLITLAGALVILAGGLYLMTGTLAGSAALLVAAGALAILTPVLKVMGGMGWGEIVKGLATLAGVFAVLGIAGLLLAPIVGPILAVGAAVALLGAGLALAGLGILAFATAITLLIAAGAAGTAALTAVFTVIIGLIPTAMKALEVALVAFAGAIAAAAPAVIAAIVVVLVALMDAIIRLTPKILQTLGVLLTSFLAFIVKYIPNLVEAGVELIIGIIQGITKKVPDIIKAGTDLIIAFIKGIGKASLDIIKAAGKTMLDFLNGLTKWIDDNAEKLGKAGGDVAAALIKGIVKGIGAGIKSIVSAIGDLAGNAIQAAKDFFHINSPSKDFIEIGGSLPEGTAVGIKGNADAVDRPIDELAARAIDRMRGAMSGISDAVAIDMNLEPVIAPVLDLDSFRKTAVGINDILTPKDITPSTSVQSAARVSTTAETLAQAQTADLAATGTTLEFNQYNTSPKALTAAEIYRQTKNQLSIVKGALPG